MPQPAREVARVTTGSDDILRVVQTLMAAQVITGGRRLTGDGDGEAVLAAPPRPPSTAAGPGKRS
ncbi:MAG: hypothetical protein JOZ69_12345 [Myxococcales bacterium]|nr:hypothetical protein [Myxococcales bacterium]